MPYRDSTVNVRVWKEEESHINLILKESGKIIHLAHKGRGDDIRVAGPFEGSRRIQRRLGEMFVT